MLIFAYMNKYTKKGLEKRKKDREGYKEFFEKHILRIKKSNAKCLECGNNLKGSVREIAHILPKSQFKSISKLDENIIYLCEEHHNYFDNRSNKDVKNMGIFKKVSEAFQSLLEKITEEINYKTYDRYE
jgi:predicted restriction endonuclease